MSEQIIHIARMGVVIDKQTVEQVVKLFDSAVLKPTDHYWMSGMSEWDILGNLITKIKIQPSPVLLESGNSVPDWMVRPKHITSKHGDQPATAKQRDFLATFGITPPSDLTKYDASRWLDKLVGNDEAEENRWSLFFRAEEEKSNKDSEDGNWAEGHKTPSGYLRSMADFILKDGKMDEESEYSDYIENAKQYTNKRVNYWNWIIRLSKSKGSEYDKLIEAGAYSGDLFTGYEDGETFDNSDGFGITTEWKLLESLVECARSVKYMPDDKLILFVLKTLDSESPTWDEESPKLLLERLATARN
jgi:hypothetical protein